MNIPTDVRVNASFPFPALVQGSGPITITKINGIWTVGYTVNGFPVQNPPPPANYATDYVLVWDSVNQVFVNVPLSAFAPSGSGSGGGPFINVASAVPAIVPDGSDQSGNLSALLTSLQAGGHGQTLWFGPGTYRFNSPIVLPNDGTGVPGGLCAHQVPIIFQGCGSQRSGQSGSYIGGTIFDIRTADPLGHIQTYGLGAIGIRDIQITDGGPSQGNPFFFTTNTTTNISRCLFVGSPDRTGLNNNQDAMVFGGTSSTTGGGTNDAFQGYGTVINENQMDGCRRFAYLRRFANAIVIRDNWMERRNGNPLANGAAIDVEGSSTNATTGTVIANNQIEIGNYPYFIKLVQASATTIYGNNLYDGTVTTIAGVLIDNATSGTLVLAGQSDIKPYVIDNSGGANTVVIAQEGASVFGDFATVGQNTFSGPAKFASPSIGLDVQSSIAGSNGARLRILRSAADVDPGAVVFSFNGNGSIDINPSNTAIASSVAITNGSAGEASFLAGLSQWVRNGTGGNMLINSGTGGSFLTQQHFGIVYNSQAGVQYAQIDSSYVGLKLGAALDIGISRSGAGVAEINTGATGGPLGALRFKTQGFTVAGLPAPGNVGARAHVTNATAPTFLGTLTGGGTVVCPVFDNGVAWVAG